MLFLTASYLLIYVNIAAAVRHVGGRLDRRSICLGAGHALAGAAALSGLLLGAEVIGPPAWGGLLPDTGNRAPLAYFVAGALSVLLGDLASAPGRCRGRAPPRRARGACGWGRSPASMSAAVVDHATFFRDPSATRKVAPALASSGPAWAMCCWCAWMTTSPSIAAPRRCCWDGTIARFSRRGPVMTPDPASRSSGSSTRRRPAPCTDDGLSHGQDPAHRRRPDAVRPDGGVSRAARFRPGAGQSRRSGRPGVSSALRRDRGAGRVAARPGWAESLPRSARPLGRADPDALRYPQRPRKSRPWTRAPTTMW